MWSKNNRYPSYGEIHEGDNYSGSSDTSAPASPHPHADTPQNSYNTTPVWPQSYKQSMDAYSSLGMGSPSFLSPSITRLSSSYLSGSFRRRPSISPLITTFVGQEDKRVTPTYQESLLPSSKHSSFKDVQDAHGVPYGCSATQAILNGINVLCGVGVLSVPYAVKEGGWLGLGLLLTFAIVSWYTGMLLRRCLDLREGLATYPDIGQAAFGMIGRLIISIILYIELYACCVEFLILEGDNLSTLFPNTSLSFGGFSLTSVQVCTILAAILILPTVLIRDLSLLSYVSAGGVVATTLVVISVIWVGVVDGVGFHETGPLLIPSNIPVAIGLYGFCYSGHAVFPNIYKSLKEPKHYTFVLTTSFIICTTVYGGVAAMGFMMFGSETESQITLNLPSQYVMSKVAVWTTIVNPFTKFALTMTPVSLCLEELFPFSNRPFRNLGYSIAVRTALVVSTLCVALLVPFFAYVMALIGSLLSMLVCLILPAACFLKIVGEKTTLFEKVFCLSIIAIGIVCAIAGTYSSVAGIIGSF